MKSVLAIVLLACILNHTTAAVISCPPNNLQDASPNLRQLCFAIEQAISDNVPAPEQYGFEESNKHAKRQDVDHVFLRFGRRL